MLLFEPTIKPRHVITSKCDFIRLVPSVFPVPVVGTSAKDFCALQRAKFTSVAKCRGSWVVGRGRGSWVWVVGVDRGSWVVGRGCG